MARGKRYTGILARPMSVEDDAELAQLPDDYHQRCNALFEHYGIDRDEADADTKLWQALAHAHVPGFGLRRPSDLVDIRWPDGGKHHTPLTAVRDKYLVDAVDAIRRSNKSLSLKQACKHFSVKNPDWGFSPEWARQRYMQLTGTNPSKSKARANMARLAGAKITPGTSGRKL